MSWATWNHHPIPPTSLSVILNSRSPSTGALICLFESDMSFSKCQMSFLQLFSTNLSLNYTAASYLRGSEFTWQPALMFTLKLRLPSYPTICRTNTWLSPPQQVLIFFQWIAHGPFFVSQKYILNIQWWGKYLDLILILILIQHCENTVLHWKCFLKVSSTLVSTQKCSVCLTWFLQKKKEYN